MNGYRLTWSIAIAAALGSGFTVHQILYEDEDGPSPGATFAVEGAASPVGVPRHDGATGEVAKRGVVPSSEQQQALFLVRSTLMALDDANRSGNYTVLRDLAGPRFQARNSALRLRQVFEMFREAGVDLSHASLVEPHVARRDLRGETGVLAVEGHVPNPERNAASSSSPTNPSAPRQQVRYAMEFEPVQGHWRLLTLSVGIEPTGRAGRSP